MFELPATLLLGESRQAVAWRDFTARLSEEFQRLVPGKDVTFEEQGFRDAVYISEFKFNKHQE